MINFVVGSNDFDVTSILYGVENYSTALYSIHKLTGKNDDRIIDLPNSYFVMDQSPIVNTTTILKATQNNKVLFLYNKVHKTLHDSLELYSSLSMVNGAAFAIGADSRAAMREVEKVHKLDFPIEELAEITYYGRSTIRKPGERLQVYFEDRIARIFYTSVLRAVSITNPEYDKKNQLIYKPELLPFDMVEDPAKAHLYLTFRTHNREYMRMLSQRFDAIYVPFNEEYSVFDPGSFFKVNNMEYVDAILSDKLGISNHEIAGQFKTVFDAMLDYIVTVHVERSRQIPVFKLSGSNSLFSALYYNLNREL